MGTDWLVNPGASGDPTHEAAGAVAVHALAVGSQEDGAG
jgi:hypothetical protein